jgi:hypothetical protein
VKTRLLILLAFVITLPACSSNDRWKLHGHWQSRETDPPCGLQFDASGTLAITLSNNEMIKGHYTLLAGDYVDFELDKEWNGSKTHREKVFITGTTLNVQDMDGTTMRFQRDYFRY